MRAKKLVGQEESAWWWEVLTLVDASGKCYNTKI